MTFRRVFTAAYKGYHRRIGIMFGSKFLFYTNVLLSMTISTLGDLIEQSYEILTEPMAKYDFNRTAHMSFSGGGTGIFCHHWYKFIDKVIVGRTLDQALKKLMLDQLIASPIMIMLFFASVSIFEDDPLENFTEEFKDKFLILYKAEWVVWPPAQLINFYFLPTKYRVVYDNSISLGYDIFTSRVKHAKKENNTDSQENETNRNDNTQDDKGETKSGE